jgi:hypothetical protein
MTVHCLFRHQPFEPEALAIMSAAYADVCRALGLSERSRAETDAVAKKVIEFAQRGVRDRHRLRERVLDALR